MIGLGSRPIGEMKCALPDMWSLVPMPPQDYWAASSPAAGCLALGRYCRLNVENPATSRAWVYGIIEITCYNDIELRHRALLCWLFHAS